ncbi:HAD family hydrolase [Caballeronia sordidicola]|uniref:HAD family hydrolase n=1 Tax=Caballeronia sordidicola TaxID=196367 RepID=A0A158I0B0_CABSO|nr:HAD family hydrolase [Caballeronia sordidicola]SAL50044.1 HAD family hydrolase [Caballeronia sordidicola]
MKTAFVFDLDGTLIDSVYQHVIAWNEALTSEGLSLPISRIHRKIGMSSELFAKQIFKELPGNVAPDSIARVKKRQVEVFSRQAPHIQPLPGASALLKALSHAGIPWAIATSGSPEDTAANLKKLVVDATKATVLTGDVVRQGKPEPDVFLAAAERLGVPIERVYVVGDSTWDLLGARRCHALGLGLKSGGTGEEELQRAGALRVYEDPADLLDHLDELATHPE